MDEKNEKTTKHCPYCPDLVEKTLDNFYSYYRKSGQLYYEKICKSCKELRSKLRYSNKCNELCDKGKLYRSLNKNKCEEYYLSNREKILSDKKEYYKNNKNHILSNVELYKSKNREIINRRQRELRANCPQVRLRNRISTSIKRVLGTNKKESILKHLPYTMQDLKDHLEKQFESWMNWNNWGVYRIQSWKDEDQSTWVWQIDHIIPHSTFKYTSMEDEEFKKCWALENLRPYSAKRNYLDGINRIRHTKYE